MADKKIVTEEALGAIASDIKTALGSKADTSSLPTKVSDLTNDSNFQTGDDVDTAIASAIANKADIDGEYDLMTVGMAKQLKSNVGENDKVPYNFRTSGGSIDIGDRETDMLVGGTIPFNQLVQTTDTSVTVTSGHKYLSKINNVQTVAISNGTAISIDDGTKDNVHDLTAMFGTTIADYIYSLEQGTPGAGVAFFRSLFPKPYYAYNAGELMSVKTSAHVMTGFNQWDISHVWWRQGNYDTAYSDKHNAATNEYIKVVGGNTYRLDHDTITGLDGQYCRFYDANYNVIGNETHYTPTGYDINVPLGAAYVKFLVYFTNDTDNIDAIMNNSNLCLHLKWDGERDGEYEPYEEHTYALDSDLELRGIPKLDANNKLYYDGDTYESDGTVTRKYEYRAYASGDESLPDTITDGTHTVTKLVTPTTETADTFTNPQIVNDFGTEEYVDTRDVAIPVGHDTFYQANLRAKLEMLPDSPSGNGDYIVRQTNGQNEYVVLTKELPTLPSTDGTYTLKCTVSGGTPTLSWVADT